MIPERSQHPLQLQGNHLVTLGKLQGTCTPKLEPKRKFPTYLGGSRRHLGTPLVFRYYRVTGLWGTALQGDILKQMPGVVAG
jgi:hypothetical protein